jgi:hypothetical protein
VVKSSYISDVITQQSFKAPQFRKIGQKSNKEGKIKQAESGSTNCRQTKKYT